MNTGARKPPVWIIIIVAALAAMILLLALALAAWLLMRRSVVPSSPPAAQAPAKGGANAEESPQSSPAAPAAPASTADAAAAHASPGGRSGAEADIGNPVSTATEDAPAGGIPITWQTPTASPREQSIWQCVTKKVAEVLKEPRRAAFPPCGAEGTSIVERSKGHCIVEGYVDAPNSLGETVRSRFQCQVYWSERFSRWIADTPEFIE